MMWNLGLKSSKSLLFDSCIYQEKTSANPYASYLWQSFKLICTPANSLYVICFPQRLLTQMAAVCSDVLIKGYRGTVKPMQQPPSSNLKTAIQSIKKIKNKKSNFTDHLLRPKGFITRFKSSKKKKICLACRLGDWTGLGETEDPVSMHNSEKSISSPLF